MAKKELFSNRIIGGFLSFFGAFPVDRGAGDMSSLYYAQDKLSTSEPVCIFVEGTRTKAPDAHPGQGKSGAAVIAARAGCDVVPVAIVYSHSRPRLFSRSYIRFGEPIPAAEFEIDLGNRREITRAAGLIMERITKMWEEETAKCAR